MSKELSTISGGIDLIHHLIKGLADDYEEAKKLFLQIWHDAVSIHDWIKHELSDLGCRTQSIELLLINCTKDATMRLMSDDNCTESYFKSGGWFIPQSKSMTVTGMELAPCHDKANIQASMFVASSSGSLAGVAGCLRWECQKTTKKEENTKAYFYMSFCDLDLQPYYMGVSLDNQKMSAKEFYDSSRTCKKLFQQYDTPDGFTVLCCMPSEEELTELGVVKDHLKAKSFMVFKIMDTPQELPRSENNTALKVSTSEASSCMG